MKYKKVKFTEQPMMFLAYSDQVRVLVSLYIKYMSLTLAPHLCKPRVYGRQSELKTLG